MMVVGFATLLITIVNATMLLNHFWNFLTEIPEKEIPHYMSRKSLLVSQVMRYVYLFVIFVVATEISRRKLWPF